MNLFARWIAQGIRKRYKGILCVLGFIVYVIVEAILMNAGHFTVAITIIVTLISVMLGYSMVDTLKERYNNYKREQGQ